MRFVFLDATTRVKILRSSPWFFVAFTMSHQQAAQDWLQSPANQAVSIWCADPETSTEKSKMGIGQKSYQTYRILYKQPGRDIVSVRHRYSEFESVRKELRDRYHPLGILVPSLPPKNSLTALAINATMNANSKLDTFFIKERTLGLTFFSEVIVAAFICSLTRLIRCESLLFCPYCRALLRHLSCATMRPGKPSCVLPRVSLQLEAELWTTCARMKASTSSSTSSATSKYRTNTR